jgi:hypothetical protein
LIYECHSEQKIDGLVRDVNEIKAILQGLNARPLAETNDEASLPRPAVGPKRITPFSSKRLWNYSAHIIEFVGSIVKDKDSNHGGSAEQELVSSLKTILESLESQDQPDEAMLLDAIHDEDPASPTMPPLDAVVAVLRWANGRFLSIHVR